MTTEAYPDIHIFDLNPAPDRGYLVKLYFFNCRLTVGPGDVVRLFKNSAFRNPDGATIWYPFSLPAAPPDHPERTTLSELPASWNRAVRDAVADAIDDYVRKSVAA